MKKVYLFYLIGLISSTSIAQNTEINELRSRAARVSKDSAAKLYVKIARSFTGINADSVRKYALIANKIAPINSVAKGDVFIQLGNSYHMENKTDSAINFYNQALIYFKKINSDKGIAMVYQSFALVKRTLGDFTGAIADSKKAFDAYDKIGWTLGKVNVLNNISNAYASLKKFDEAVIYSRQSLSLSKLLNDSLKYYFTMSEYGGKLAQNKKYDSAFYYIDKATPYLERQGQYNTLLVLNSSLAIILKDYFNNNDLAKKCVYKSMRYAKLSGATDNLRYLYYDLANLYLSEKALDSAEIYYKKTINFIDSTNNQKALELTKELQTKYETEKKDLQIKQATSELNLEEEKNKRKTTIIWLGTAAFIGTLFFLVIAVINYKKARKANSIIQNQNQVLELQKKEVENQKHIIEEKQSEIISSINYAQRIQSAVLTGEEVWKKISNEHFIVFQPRDIVSGDFYWAHVLANGRAIFVLADCTGHGVPGGFMSMLGNSFLNELVVENKLFKADEILNRLREKVIAALFQKGQTEQKDGMDMALCVWNKMDNTLEFAGANNALYIVREGKLLEYKGDKMPIGSYLEENKKFASQKISLQKDDVIYLSTDGYADQFGGQKGKKFKYKQLEELLVTISTLSPEQQKQTLISNFLDWKNNYEQTDDVSLIGIKVI